MNIEHNKEQAEAVRQEFGKMWVDEMMPTIKNMMANADLRTIWLVEHMAWKAYKTAIKKHTNQRN